MGNKPHETPSDIIVEEGEVVIDGPDGVAFSFTPEAALETSDRLLHGGLKAKGQRVAAERRNKPLFRG